MRTVALALLAGSAQAAFDRNHNGKLEPGELDALKQFLQRSMK